MNIFVRLKLTTVTKNHFVCLLFSIKYSEMYALVKCIIHIKYTIQSDTDDHYYQVTDCRFL